MPVPGRYDAPEYCIVRDQQYDRVAIGSSTLGQAKFIARALMYVSNVVVGIRSAASLAALGMITHHHATPATAGSIVAAKTLTWISATSIGSYQTMALNRTLNAGEAISLVFNDAKGKVHVSYTYQLLPPVG